ncbi:ZBED4 protein, partial [Polyodon spathula]|nr:ZBED4 protein [Polyodon spathula]
MHTELPQLYDKAAGNIVLTLDIWTSRATEAYLPVLCHFIDENWQQQSYIMETSNIPGQTSLEFLLQQCSTIVGFFHHSTKAAENLKEIQKQLNIPEHKLIQSLETRWNSIFYMLDRIPEQLQVITASLCLLGRNTLCLMKKNWYEKMSVQNYVSISKVIPLVTVLQITMSSAE